VSALLTTGTERVARAFARARAERRLAVIEHRLAELAGTVAVLTERVK